MWADADPIEVRAVWGEELVPFDGVDIRAAIEACRTAYPDYPPTLFQFSALCRDASRRRTASVPKLEGPRRGSSGIAPEVLAQIHTLLDKGRQRDPKDWARRVLKRADAGEPMPLIAITSAKEALGIS
jgi:hypothetical protein